MLYILSFILGFAWYSNWRNLDMHHHILFFMSLWVYIHTKQAEKLAWPGWNHHKKYHHHIHSDRDTQQHCKPMTTCIMAFTASDLVVWDLEQKGRLFGVHLHFITVTDDFHISIIPNYSDWKLVSVVGLQYVRRIISVWLESWTVRARQCR
jgi:hypothetical protein